MANLLIVVLGGMIAVVAFDTAAAVASRRFGFSYAIATPGSFLIYGALGYFAAQLGATLGVAAGISGCIGLFDSKVGLAVAKSIAPISLPEDMTPEEWMTAEAIVVMLAAAAGAVGAAAALA